MNDEVRPAAPDVEWANYVVVQVVQALLGLISPRVNAISVRADRDEVTLFYSMSEVDEADREDIDDACFELDVLLEGTVLITADVQVGEDRVTWHG